jgi:hypothetical protein
MVKKVGEDFQLRSTPPGLRSKKPVVTPLQTEFNNWSNAEQPHEA